MSIVLAKSHGWVHAPKGLGRHLSTRLHATNLALGGIRPARRHRTLTCARHSRRPRRPLPRPTTKQGIVVQFLRADPRPRGGLGLQVLPAATLGPAPSSFYQLMRTLRSEERRVGKEWTIPS